MNTIKIHEIVTIYGLNRRTFYSWLRENGLIEKTETGYITGENALEGMTISTYRRLNQGVFFESTQVTVEEKKVPILVNSYIHSGMPRIYSKKNNKENLIVEINLLKDVVEQHMQQTKLISEQLYLLTEQLHNKL